MGKQPVLTPPFSAALTCLLWSLQPLSEDNHMSLLLCPHPICSAHSACPLGQSKVDLSQHCHLVWNKDIHVLP